MLLLRLLRVYEHYSAQLAGGMATAMTSAVPQSASIACNGSAGSCVLLLLLQACTGLAGLGFWNCGVGCQAQGLISVRCLQPVAEPG
jgi:hypothetical protein